MTISVAMTWAIDDQGQSSALLTKIFSESMVLFGEKERARARSQEQRKRVKGAGRSRLITQNGSRVNTLDVSRVEAQSRSDSLQRDVQACIRFAARSERMAPAGPIQLDDCGRVTRDDNESSRSQKTQLSIHSRAGTKTGERKHINLLSSR